MRKGLVSERDLPPMTVTCGVARLGIAAPLAANAASDPGHGLTGAAVAAWAAVALIGSYEVTWLGLRLPAGVSGCHRLADNLVMVVDTVIGGAPSQR
jgi:hypothetical protein